MQFKVQDEKFKFKIMMAYLFELGYDLAISSPSKNVSDNPGFESALGQRNRPCNDEIVLRRRILIQPYVGYRT